jgi:hypothetical protein
MRTAAVWRYRTNDAILFLPSGFTKQTDNDAYSRTRSTTSCGNEFEQWAFGSPRGTGDG